MYLLNGNTKKAAQITNDLIESLNKHADPGENGDLIHYADRELAYAYLLTNNYDKALQHALAEYNRRPKNIDVNETVAWVYYKRREYDKALPFITAALKTNCKNPTLLSHAGLIYAKNNQVDKAKTLLQEALKNNPNIDQQLKAEAQAVLQKI